LNIGEAQKQCELRKKRFVAKEFIQRAEAIKARVLTSPLSMYRGFMNKSSSSMMMMLYGQGV
jgi:hypothetical protein